MTDDWEFWSRFHREFPGRTLARAREVFVRWEDFAEAVSWFRAHEAAILGFDGFRIEGDAIYPLMDYIADFSALTSSPDRVARSCEEALQVAEEWGPEGPPYVSFVVD